MRAGEVLSGDTVRWTGVQRGSRSARRPRARARCTSDCIGGRITCVQLLRARGPCGWREIAIALAARMRAVLQRGTSQRGLRQPLLAVLEAGPGDQMRAGAAVRAIAMLPRSGVVCVMHDDGTVCGYVRARPAAAMRGLCRRALQSTVWGCERLVFVLVFRRAAPGLIGRPGRFVVGTACCPGPSSRACTWTRCWIACRAVGAPEAAGAGATPSSLRLRAWTPC